MRFLLFSSDRVGRAVLEADTTASAELWINIVSKESGAFFGRAPVFSDVGLVLVSEIA